MQGSVRAQEEAACWAIAVGFCLRRSLAQLLKAQSEGGFAFIFYLERQSSCISTVGTSLSQPVTPSVSLCLSWWLHQVQHQRHGAFLSWWQKDRFRLTLKSAASGIYSFLFCLLAIEPHAQHQWHFQCLLLSTDVCWCILLCQMLVKKLLPFGKQAMKWCLQY